MKRLICLLMGAVLVLSLAGCSSVKSALDTVKEERADSQESQENQESQEAEEDREVPDLRESREEEEEEEVQDVTGGYAEGRMGDTMETYFFDYTINSAYLCDEFNDYLPLDGNRLLVAEATVKNTFNESIVMYDTDFQVQWNSTGEDDYDVPITYYADPVSDEQLPAEYELGINKEVTGLLVFEVPEGRKDFSISYLELFDDDSEGDVYFVFFTADEE